MKVNGVNEGAVFAAQEMEAFKVEIIKEVRKEFQKMKQEIVEGKDTRVESSRGSVAPFAHVFLSTLSAVRTELSRR